MFCVAHAPLSVPTGVCATKAQGSTSPGPSPARRNVDGVKSNAIKRRIFKVTAIILRLRKPLADTRGSVALFAGEVLQIGNDVAPFFRLVHVESHVGIGRDLIGIHKPFVE